ncbi:hypothetical protein [Arthrobacter sp. Soil763]|uniref:hypothetical protein n=1 Tax=Arthrobacter sp. Soil763 TaxID=1736402 RepID=UPI0007000578|nr:hypothetical protein [Arthrobacter sp. Soil763]KRE80222.1 hypothetical protein ASG71_09525 [Arthrobacter sp. Soil763]
MSQEQPPIRSRRELRQARGERQDANPGAETPDNPANAARPEAPTEAETTGRRRIPGPVDSVRTTSAAERSSQIRARDRAALRTIKELAEKEGQLSPGGTPTRRQLRLQQLAEETAPATSANPIVPMPSPRTRSHPVVAPKAAAGKGPEAPGAASGASEAAAPAPGTAPTGASAGPAPEPKLPEGMSVEQALAARELLAEQARNQVAKMEHIAATDPDAVNPEVLAEQIALAERAAVLNRRAAAKQKLAAQNNQPAAPRPGQPRTEAPSNGPSTASNLAMVTPLEFEAVPGIDRPVMKRPATSYVPLVTNSSPKVQPPRTARRPGSSRKRDTGPADGRSGVLARAEAAAQAASVRRQPAGVEMPAEEEPAARPPVAANAAYGLDPLDAATAGLGRARRLRALQLGVLALGVLALIAGIILIITGLAG